MANTSKNRTRIFWFLRNLLWAIILIFALILLTQFLLGRFTRHNKEFEVPDFYGLQLDAAETVARDARLRLDVTDSVYVSRLERGAVFSQNPEAGSHVKRGRRILITINATQTQQVEMPSLVGLSLRAAKTEILAKGLRMGTLSYTQDMATNNVLQQRLGNDPVAPGTKVDVGSAVNLVLGVSPGENVTYIPLLSGYTEEMAREMIIENSLNIAGVSFDSSVKTPEDSLAAVVYSQSPAATGGTFPRGTKVSIYLTVDPAKIAALQQEAGAL